MKITDITRPMLYLMKYREMKRKGYRPKTARLSAQVQVGYYPDTRGYWQRYWKFR